MRGRVVLVNPNFQDGTNPDPQEYNGLGSLHAFCLSRGIDCHVVDGFCEGLDARAVADRVAALAPDVLGFTLIWKPSLDAVRAVREALPASLRSVCTVVGGPYVAYYGRRLVDTLPWVSAACLGDGEAFLWRLMEEETWKTGRFGNVPGAIWADGSEVRSTPADPLPIGELPAPTHESLAHALERGTSHSDGERRYTRWANVFASRGCYRNCFFCIHHKNDENRRFAVWRPRPAASVVEECTSLREGFGVEYIYFVDDCFVGPGRKGREHTLRLVEGLAAAAPGMRFFIKCMADDIDPPLFRTMAASGLTRVFIGLESFVAGRLRRFNKGHTVHESIEMLGMLDTLGVRASVGFILFDPLVTLEEIDQELSALRRYVAGRGQLLKVLQSALWIPEGSGDAERYREYLLDTTDPLGGMHYRFADGRAAQFESVLGAALTALVPIDLRYWPSAHQAEVRRIECAVLDLAESIAAGIRDGAGDDAVFRDQIIRAAKQLAIEARLLGILLGADGFAPVGATPVH